MKILIIGDGPLGSSIAAQAQKYGHTVYQTSRRNPGLIHLDLENPDMESLPVADWTVMAAGISGYARCEDNPLSRTVNVDKTIAVCSALIEKGSMIFYPSSTAVFDGNKPFMKPDAPVCPETEYGRQKAEVESFLLSTGRAAVIRFSKILSPLSGILPDWIDSMSNGKSINAFTDLFFSPILFEDAALAACRLMEKRVHGVFHCSGPEEVSYHDFARKLCMKGGYDEGLVKAGSCRSIPGHFPAHSSLDASATERLINFSFPPIDRLIERAITARNTRNSR